VATQKYVSENYGRGSLELLKKALPRQLERTVKMIESFIAHRTALQTEKRRLKILTG